MASSTGTAPASDPSGATGPPPRQAAVRPLIGLLIFFLPIMSTSFTQVLSGTVWILSAIAWLIVGLASGAVAWQMRAHLVRSPAVWLLPALTASFVLSFAFHASWIGLGLVLSSCVACAVGSYLATYTRQDIRTWIALPLFGAVAVQAFVIWGQTATRTSWIATVIQPERTILVTDGIVRPHGLMIHVYEPPALALLSIGVAVAVLPSRGTLRYVFLAGFSVASSVIALTHSRSALLGFVLVVAALMTGVARGDRHLRLPLVLLVIAFLIPAAITFPGWSSRLDDSLATDVDDAALGRLTLVGQAIKIASDNPIVGVGPGQYLSTLERDYEIDSRYPFIVHNVPLAIAAELGVPAALAFTTLLLVMASQLLGGNPRNVAAFIAPLGFFFFDVLHYDRPIGLLMLGVWAGVLASVWTRGAADRDILVQ